MHKQIVQVIEEKLTQALREADALTEERIRAAWSEISPSPSCPSVGTVMKAIHQSIVQGYLGRERVTKEIVHSTLTPIRAKLTPRLCEEILALVTKAFPEDTFLSLAQHTPGVYLRRNAPENKSEKNIYSLEHSLLTASAKNISRQSVANVRTALNEMLLQEAIANPAWWKRAPTVILKFGVVPALKWAFGIVSAVAIAALTYIFGIK